MGQPSIPSNVDRLLARLLEEDLQASEMEFLNEALHRDASLRELYRKYMIVNALLRWEVAPALVQLDGKEGTGSRVQGWETTKLQSTIDNQQSAAPPIILDLSPTHHASLFSLHSTVGGFLFSYVAGVLLLGIALLIAWTWKIPHDRQVVEEAPRPAPRDQRGGDALGRPGHRHG